MSILNRATQKLKSILGLHKKEAGSLGEGYDPGLVRFFMSDEFHQLEKRYNAFKVLLTHNNNVLNSISDIQERVASQLITLPYFNKEITNLLNQMDTFVEALNDLSHGRYKWLNEVLNEIKEDILKDLLTESLDKPQLIYPLNLLSSIMSLEVGGKAGNLGEVKNILHVPTPEGFVISSACYSKIISENGIDKLIDILMDEIKSYEDTQAIIDASKRIHDLIMEARIPEDIQEEIIKMADKLNDISLFAVRSSAIGEDGRFSFAGQFKSLLGIRKEEILKAYREVCASLYSERAIKYRLANKIPQDHNIAMSVLVLELIKSKVSGVVYSLNPVTLDSDELIVTGVWGLGISAVDGSISPDTYCLDRKNNGKILRQEIGNKESEYIIDESGKVKRIPVAGEKALKPCLNEEILHKIYDISMMIEKHFGIPQDIEWAIDSMGWLYILQARPLSMKRPIVCKFINVDETPVLKGDPVSSGAEAGPVFVINEKINTVPRGVIIISKTMDPEFAKFIPQSSGLIAETGSPATHLASVAREYQKPAITNAKNATGLFTNGEIITIDANQGKVYRGYIDSLIKMRLYEAESSIQDDKNLPLMKRIMKKVLPLTLTKLQDNVALEVAVKREDFKTLHDIIRFVHEASVREMFQLGVKGESVVSHTMIDPQVPLKFYIIDIEGGISPRAVFKKRIEISDIQSRPFLSLWKGMTHEGVSWTGPVQFDLGGFFSVMSRSFVEGNVTERGGKAYVILSKDYLNFHCRLAYHFTVIDSVCSEESENNYITFRFEGGGAGADGRMRRILLLKDILQALYFRVDIKGDFLTGVFRGGSIHETESRLDQLGRLMAFTRQLDMTLRDEDIRRRYVNAFLEGLYSPLKEEDGD